MQIVIVPGGDVSDAESTTIKSGAGRSSNLLTRGVLVFAPGGGAFCAAQFFESLKPAFSSSTPTLCGNSSLIQATWSASHPLMPATSTKTVEAPRLRSSAAAARLTRETMSTSCASVTTTALLSIEFDAGDPCKATTGCKTARMKATMISLNARMFLLSGSSIPDLRLQPKHAFSSPHTLNAGKNQAKHSPVESKM